MKNKYACKLKRLSERHKRRKFLQNRIIKVRVKFLVFNSKHHFIRFKYLVKGINNREIDFSYIANNNNHVKITPIIATSTVLITNHLGKSIIFNYENKT
jgi:hypothetical protein